MKSYLYNKQAIFVGNSGVGKSSLTNAIMEEGDIKQVMLVIRVNVEDIQLLHQNIMYGKIILL